MVQLYNYIYYTFIIKGDVAQMVEYHNCFLERNED